MPFIDPHQVTITTRQRSELEVADLEESIERLGQLQPIVCRDMGDSGAMNLVLVAGARRLQACKNLSRLIEYVLLNTLDEFSARCAELEENIKRSDLLWVDRARAIYDIHELYRSNHPKWSMENTAEKIGVKHVWVFLNIRVVKFAEGNPKIYDLPSIDQAITVINRTTDRIISSYIDEITHVAQEAFSERHIESTTKNSVKDSAPIGSEDTDVSDVIDTDVSDVNDDSYVSSDVNTNLIIEVPTPQSPPTPPTIICADFLQWAPIYNGPRFNFIHCDFPYGVNIGGRHGLRDNKKYENDPEIFFTLTNCLTTSFDRIASYSCHLMFWFTFKWYHETLNALRSVGLEVIIPPIIWYHSDNRGMSQWLDGVMQPRRVYDVAFIASRGGRQLLRDEVPNLYGAPLVSHPIHPTQKPEPMLRHFFSMIVDNTTTMLDPTAGSGSALNAAEGLGAKSVLGLELDPEYVEGAASYLNNQRILRRLSKEIK